MSYSNMIVIGADKGGGGKSTVAANLAGELAAQGWKTLLVELDYQADLLVHLGCTDQDFGGGRHLMDAMIDGERLEIVHDVGGRAGLDYVPAGRWTRRLTNALANDPPEHDLETVLAPIAGNYNVIICDTRPEVDNQLLIQALACARFVLIPFKVGMSDLKAVGRFRERVEQVRNLHNPDLEILGSILLLWARGDSGLADYLAEREAESGVRPLRNVICAAIKAQADLERRGLLAGEYAIKVEELLRERGYSRAVSDAGYQLSVAGARITKAQRERGLPDDVEVVGDVRLGGGLAGDYYFLTRELMELLIERTQPRAAPAVEVALSAEHQPDDHRDPPPVGPAPDDGPGHESQGGPPWASLVSEPQERSVPQESEVGGR